MRRRRISTRLLLSHLLVAVLPLAALAVFYLFSFETAQRQAVLENMATIADKKAEQIDTYMAERLVDARLLGQTALVREAVATLAEPHRRGGVDDPAYRAAARQLRQRLGRAFDPNAFDDLLLMDTAGTVVFSMAQESELGASLEHGPYRNTELARGYALTMQTLQTQLTRFAVYAPSGFRPAAFLVAPVLENGVARGALALQLNVDRLETVTADRTGLGRSGETVLAQKQGDTALYTAPLRHVPDAAYRHRITLRDPELPIWKALHGGHGCGFSRDYAGHEVVAAWRYLPALDWGMVVKIDAAEALAPAARLRGITYSALVLILLAAGLAAWFLGRRLSRPVETLTEVADRIAAGDLTRRAPPAGIDELGRLAVAFNHMTDALAASRHNLEAQVAARSQELRAVTEQQNAILDDAAALILVLDREGRIRRFNRACERLTQYAFAEVEGKFAWDLFVAPDERDAVRDQAFGALAENPLAVRGTYTNHWVTRDGARHLIEWSNSVLLDAQGRMEFMIAIGTDVTERHIAEKALRESARQLNEAQRIAQVGSWEFDLASGKLAWSDEVFRLFEVDTATFSASYEAFLDAVHPEDRERVNAAYAQSLESRVPCEITHRLRMPDGRVKWVNERCETHFDAQGKPIRSTGTVQDITARKEAEEALRLYASVFEHSGEALVITDSANHIVAVNPAFTRQTGYVLDDVQGRDPGILASGHTPRETYQAMWSALEQSGYWQGELMCRRKDHTLYPKWMSVSVMRGPDGRVTHYIASFTDITERKQAEAQISRLAYQDALTGLLNRFSLQSQLEQALAMAEREKRSLAVAFLDLDRFKTINDTMGHAVGDQLLREAARRLRDSVRHSDIIARLGGDEFVVVLTEVDDVTAAARVADKILHALAQPYRIDHHRLHSTASIGLAFYPDDGKDGDALMKNADTAMYHAKAQGRNNVQFFTEEMNVAAVQRLMLERDLRAAVDAGQFALHYQAQVDGRDGRTVGFEALLRWHHPREGLLLPELFVPLAEETGLILQLGEWVLDEACRQLRAWRDAGIEGLTMAVNLSAHQLRSPQLVSQVAHALARHRLRGSDLEFEVTESVAMHDPELSVSQLEALRDLGVNLSIDDFGTGYSSLSYLKLLPIHTLKLDKSFVVDLEHSANDVAICTATIALAHSLGLTVTAEGVETEAQRAFLNARQCDFMQGYLFSPPLPGEAVLAFLCEARAALP